MSFNLTPKAFRKLWVDALRSGRFTQGQHKLTSIVSDPHRGRGLVENDCCLGVACKLYVENGGELQVHVNEQQARVEYGSSNEHAFLPDVVMHALGLTDNTGTVEFIGNDNPEFSDEEGFITDQLAELNDDYLSFTQIADLIEAGLVETDDLAPTPA